MRPWPSPKPTSTRAALVAARDLRETVVRDTRFPGEGQALRQDPRGGRCARLVVQRRRRESRAHRVRTRQVLHHAALRRPRHGARPLRGHRPSTSSRELLTESWRLRAPKRLLAEIRCFTGAMKKLADYGTDDHPADDPERVPITWIVAALDDCDECRGRSRRADGRGSGQARRRARRALLTGLRPAAARRARHRTPRDGRGPGRMRSQAPLVTLRPMTEAEYSTWRPHSLATYATDTAQRRADPSKTCSPRSRARWTAS